ncbi:MAG: hypothetical protein HFG82_03985 [Dorea sp.]|jgi:N-acetylglucosamine kinase-like BadF-type ATPase|nr:hypothetical protein [Dorea sp.]
MYFIGVDGGGTKTEFLLTDDQGLILASYRAGSTSYKHVGMPECIRILKSGIEAMERMKGELKKEAAGVCFALPNFGESKEADRILEEEIAGNFEGYQTMLVNDSEVGWAGSLGLSPGMNLVAGTGSIVFGKDDKGNTARAGGWSDYFSDEGSCNWLGKKTMELFSKESDGRVDRGPLLEIMRESFKLGDDFDMIDIFERDYQNNRTSTAGLQKLLLQAARQGDRGAVKLYQEAARELAACVLAVYRRMEHKGSMRMSYSGGLFHAGAFVLEPLREALKEYPIQMEAPLFSPVQGAVLLAAERFAGVRETKRLKRAWQET